MREKSTDLWDWIKCGAFFYVCGDAERMALDVDDALHNIIEKEGRETSVSTHGINEIIEQGNFDLFLEIFNPKINFRN